MGQVLLTWASDDLLLLVHARIPNLPIAFEFPEKTIHLHLSSKVVVSICPDPSVSPGGAVKPSGFASHRISIIYIFDCLEVTPMEMDKHLQRPKTIHRLGLLGGCAQAIGVDRNEEIMREKSLRC